MEEKGGVNPTEGNTTLTRSQFAKGFGLEDF